MTGQPDGPADAGPSVLRDCKDAAAHVGSVCCTHGPPRLTGVELEWRLHRPTVPDTPVDVATPAAVLGPHAPTTIDPSSPARPRAADPSRSPTRLFQVQRYRAMEEAFDRIGPHGRSAMCSTSAVQVCVDAGEGPDIGNGRDAARRWVVLHALGPALLAAFANSPLLHGRRTGWKSSRWAAWRACDPPRTVHPPAVDVDPDVDPATGWARRVLAAPLRCVRGEDTWRVPHGVTFADWVNGAFPAPPTTADLDHHVSTLFPPVRPHGHRVRGLPRVRDVPVPGVLASVLRRRLPNVARRLVRHRQVGAAFDVPQLGPPDPPADLLRLPVRP